MSLRTILGIVAVLLVLSITHLWAVRRGAREAASRLAPAARQIEETADLARLHFAMEPLRLLARHTGDLPAEDVQALCNDVEGYAESIERNLLPEMEAAGDRERAQRYRQKVEEAKKLLAVCRFR